MKLNTGKRVRILVCLIGTYAAGAQATGGKRGDSLKSLPFPDEIHSAELLSRSVMALYQDGGKLVAMPDSKGFAMVAAFDVKGTTRDKVFGAITDMQRLVVLKEEVAVPDWRGIDLVDDRALFFDGKQFAWSEADPKTMNELLRRSIPWDMLRPPRDSRGEPTTPEIQALRTTFKKAWSQTLGLKAAGVARIPSKWVGVGPKRAYAVALRVKGFPLALMECDTAEPSSCQLIRQCYLEGASDLSPDAVTGIAVSVKRKMLFIGDSKNRLIHGFRFDSCYNVPRVQRMAIPVQFKTLTNLFIDRDDRLWASTAAADDFLNASVYYWAPDVW